MKFGLVVLLPVRGERERGDGSGSTGGRQDVVRG